MSDTNDSGNPFGSLGLDKVKDQADGIPDGKYAGFVFNSQIVSKKDGTRAWVLTYKPDRKIHPSLDPEASQAEWHDLDYPATMTPDAIETKKRWLKRRILSLGVKEENIATFALNDVIGTPVAFTIKSNGPYKNIGTVELRDENEYGAYQTADSSDIGLKDLM
jgi:hypothetical protein